MEGGRYFQATHSFQSNPKKKKKAAHNAAINANMRKDQKQVFIICSDAAHPRENSNLHVAPLQTDNFVKEDNDEKWLSINLI